MKETLWEALALLARRDPDRARERNDSGFSQGDGPLGHYLVAVGPGCWSEAMTAAAARLVRRYRRQLEEAGLQGAVAVASARADDGNGGGTVEPVTVTASGDEVVVAFAAYDPARLSRFKVAVRRRRWDGEARVWRVPASEAREVLAWAEREKAHVAGAVAASSCSYRVEAAGAELMVRSPLELRLAVKALPGARWDPLARVWRVAPTPEARELARQHGLEWTEEAERAVAAEESRRARLRQASAALTSLERSPLEGVSLYPFQAAGVEYVLAADGRAIIADEMGLGKTLQALAVLEARQAYPALVVCPNLSGLGPRKWAGEAIRALPGRRVTILGEDGTVRVRLPGGGYRDVPANDPLAELSVVNYDRLPGWTEADPERRKRGALRPRPGTPLATLARRGLRGLVVDEVHYVKNHRALRTRAVEGMARGVPVKVALSGTPLLNRPAELIAPLTILGRLEDLGGFWMFVRRYCGARQGRYGLDLSGASNLEELNERLRETCYVRRLKRDVLPELPAKQREAVELEIADRQEYAAAEADTIRWLGERAAQDAEFLASIADLDPEEQQRLQRERRASAEAAAARAEALVRIGALRRLAARGKLPAVEEWVRALVEGGVEKLVIFAHHRDVQEALARRLHDLWVVRVEGGRAEANVEAVRRFQERGPRIAVVSLAAGREGIELTAASHVAFAELPWRPGDLDQAEDRLYGRLNDPHGVNSYYLLGRATIDVDMAELIDAKREVIDRAVDGRAGTSGEPILGALIGRLLARGGG
ncbi:MAG: DEAD/DEAH box helicase [Armatimonadota bacterium]|nr:DEAD/DEAH box helicase [Armatimonadota bacterium]